MIFSLEVCTIRAYRISLYTFFAQTETHEVPEDCHRRNEENGGSIDKIYIVAQLVIRNYVYSHWIVHSILYECQIVSNIVI